MAGVAEGAEHQAQGTRSARARFLRRICTIF
jgi:hypothetical protein